ncbi:MAG: hypothetical protein IKU01_08535 [Bacteroidales bacterium]|nr:hypothetical protein [Bacteroidales bacterium]
MQRCKDINKAVFYIQQTLENNWSRNVLDWQIDSNLKDLQRSLEDNIYRFLLELQILSYLSILFYYITPLLHYYKKVT